MLSLPSSPLDRSRLADWLELRAVAAADNNSSRGDLESALYAAALFDGSHPDALEELLVAVLNELYSRAAAAPHGYPFDLSGGTLSLKERPWEDYGAYLLCLCLSYFGSRPVPGVPVFPERLFESLCATVAANYIGGQAVRFGAPRTRSEIDPVFTRAVVMLCRDHLREGVAVTARQRVPGDQGLDIVAWRGHPDGRSGKLILFGACATGANWIGKVFELQPEPWKDKWLSSPIRSPIVRAFFVPHRVVPDDDWSDWVSNAGIPFDRCRIAEWSPALPVGSPHGDGVAWARETIRRGTS